MILSENNQNISRQLSKPNSLEENDDGLNNNDNEVVNLQSEGDEFDEGVLNREKLNENNNQMIEKILQRPLYSKISNSCCCFYFKNLIFIFFIITFIYL